MFKHIFCPSRSKKLRTLLIANNKSDFHTTCSLNIKNYYQILSVPRNASQKEIKEAYYEKARLHHPDTNKNSSGSMKFQEISEAYEILSDNAKRRTYDSTTLNQPNFGSHTYQNDVRDSRNSPRPSEPISMSHIHHVYRTLNKEEEEQPRFRPFEDHSYPGTDFSRFEYSRRWDSDSKAWVYMKRPTAGQYNKKMQKNHRILQACLAVLSLGVLVHIMNYKFFLRSMSNQSLKRSDDISREGAGMYIIGDNSDR